MSRTAIGRRSGSGTGRSTSSPAPCGRRTSSSTRSGARASTCARRWRVRPNARSASTRSSSTCPPGRPAITRTDLGLPEDRFLFGFIFDYAQRVCAARTRPAHRRLPRGVRPRRRRDARASRPINADAGPSSWRGPRRRRRPRRHHLHRRPPLRRRDAGALRVARLLRLAPPQRGPRPHPGRGDGGRHPGHRHRLVREPRVHDDGELRCSCRTSSPTSAPAPSRTRRTPAGRNPMPTLPRRRCDDSSITPTTPGRSVPESGIDPGGHSASRPRLVRERFAEPPASSPADWRAKPRFGSVVWHADRGGPCGSGATDDNVFISYAQNHEDVVLARALRPDRPARLLDRRRRRPPGRRLRHRRVRPTVDGAASTSSRCPTEAERCASDPTPRRQPAVAVGRRARDGQAVRGPAGQPRRVDDGPRPRRPLQPARARSSRPIEVEVTTLADIVAEHVTARSVDFLKVDVEGMEAEVLAGCRLVDASAPHRGRRGHGAELTEPSHETWEPPAESAGYRLALFDGLNRFYVERMPSEPELLDRPVGARERARRLRPVQLVAPGGGDRGASRAARRRGASGRGDDRPTGRGAHPGMGRGPRRTGRATIATEQVEILRADLAAAQLRTARALEAAPLRTRSAKHCARPGPSVRRRGSATPTGCSAGRSSCDRIPVGSPPGSSAPEAVLSIEFALTTTSADKVEADLLVVPVFADRVLGPGADAVDAALGGARRLHGRGRVRRQAGPGPRGADRGRARSRRRAPRRRRRRATSSTSPRCAGPRPRSPAGRARSTTVATTLARRAPPPVPNAAGGRAGARRGRAARRLPVPRVQVETRRRRSSRRCVARRAAASARSQAAVDRGCDRRGRGDLGARHRERAGGLEVAGGLRRRGEEAPRAARVSRSRCSTGAQIESRGDGRRARRRAGIERPAALREGDLRAGRRRAARSRSSARASSFDSGGLSIKPAERHGDDEDRHGRRRRRARRDVGRCATWA